VIPYRHYPSLPGHQRHTLRRSPGFILGQEGLHTLQSHNPQATFTQGKGFTRHEGLEKAALAGLGEGLLRQALERIVRLAASTR
jgi:hypothetical protein